MPGRYDAHDMFMLQQYLEKHLESSSNNYSSKTFPFAVDQMTYENKIINHDVANNLEMLQQTLDNIVVDSFACGSNYDPKSLEVFQKREMSVTNLQT